MLRSQLLYLNDIAEATGNIRVYVGDLTFDEFRNERMRVDAGLSAISRLSGRLSRTSVMT